MSKKEFHLICKDCHCEFICHQRNSRCKPCNSKSKSGSNNPMYGKSVFDVWVIKYGLEEALIRQNKANEKNAKSISKCWEDPEYRENNITKNTGKKRTEEFKEIQSKNAIKQMKDPAQREIRSKSMTKSFETGKIEPHGHPTNRGIKGYWNGIYYMSKCELKRMQKLTENNIKWEKYKVTDFDFRIHYFFDGKEHLYIPDLVLYIDGRIIFEEIKYNLRKITDQEIVKGEAATKILKEHNIEYRIVTHNSPIL